MSDISINVTGIGAIAVVLRATAEISHVNAHTDVFLNYSSKNKQLPETILLSELTVMLSTKSLSDSAAVTDVYASSFSTATAEPALVVSDVFSSFTMFERLFSDTLLIRDSDYYISTNEDLSFNSKVINFHTLSGISRQYDTISIGVGKDEAQDVSELDASTVTDIAGVSANKVVADALTVPDIASTSLHKGASDAFAFADAYSVSAAKAIIDSATASDTTSMVTGVVPSDSAPMLDLYSSGIAKPFTDSVSLSDAVLIGFLYSRDVADAIQITDEIVDTPTAVNSVALNETTLHPNTLLASDLTIQVNKTEAQAASELDTASLSDVETLTTAKVITDSVTALDAVSQAITSTLSGTIGATDGAGISDVSVATITKVLTDAVSISDAVEVTRGTLLTLSHSATTSDAFTVANSSVNAEAVGASDITTATMNKFFNDAVTTSDTTTLTSAFSDTTSNAAVLSDVISVSFFPASAVNGISFNAYVLG